MARDNSLLDASCRVAFAALMHDLGKFAERAALPGISAEALSAHITQYCPFRDGRYHSHRHAAWTALVFDTLEKYVPDLIQGNVTPFSTRQNNHEVTDSLINAAAMHHRPETFLQWVIASADRIASGFERSEFDRYNAGEDKTDTGRNHYQARQLSLLEQIRLEHNEIRPQQKGTLKWRYQLKALSPNALFPVPSEGYEPVQDKQAQTEYRELWNQFISELGLIPAAHRQQWALWLDHFDTAWQCFTHAIPSATAFGVKPEVSLYDHSKTTSALATALWRWHEAHRLTGEQAIASLKERADWDEQKFLLIQGDFFGIQDFIFADGSQTNRSAARLLRGRSFQVSLFTELAALKILEACNLPPTSQIINAAGKFLIVAPNTGDVRQALDAVRRELDAWFLEHSFGLAGIGIVAKAASSNDFLKKRFSRLMTELFSDLEDAKLKRFDLTQGEAILPIDYASGVCPYNNKLPADSNNSAPLSRDQIKLGTQLTHKNRLLVIDDPSHIKEQVGMDILETLVFGFHVAFTGNEMASGKFGALARDRALLRCWDFSLPENLNASLWQGYARRYINAYIPRFNENSLLGEERYGNLLNDTDFKIEPGGAKSLNHIACEDRQPNSSGSGWQGQIALMTLKGDIDDLGLIFQKGLNEPTFAKMVALSRQINGFFATWLPAWCATHYPDTYTVFAGGDDFFLIGPWKRTQQLATDMARHFHTYVSENPDIHFSVGMVMCKPGLPIHTLVTQADEALESAKSKGKNAVTLFDEHIPWAQWPEIQAAEQELENLAQDYPLSTSYVYGLLHLIDLATQNPSAESAMWRSRFAYRTHRYVADKLPPSARPIAQTRLATALGERGIAQLGSKYRIPVFNYFYRQR